MSTSPSGPGLGHRLLRNAAPAYVLPAVQVWVTSRVIDDPELGIRALTTIAIPSVVAAIGVTLALGRPEARPPAPARWARLGRALALGALLPAAVVAFGVAVLVGNGLAPFSLLVDAVPSAAVGGGLTALMWARARHFRQVPVPSPAPLGTAPKSVSPLAPGVTR